MSGIGAADDDASVERSDLHVFTYAVVEKAELYVAVLDALVGAKERFRLQLRPAEVARDLPGVAEAEVAEALARLDRKSTRLNSSHPSKSRMPSSA